jgi:hypothetical protein
VYVRITHKKKQPGTPSASSSEIQNPLISDIFYLLLSQSHFCWRKKKQGSKIRAPLLLGSLLQARSSSTLCSSAPSIRNSELTNTPAPSSINPTYYPNRLPSDPSPSRNRLAYPQAKRRKRREYLAGSVAGDALLRPHAGLQRGLARSAPAAEGRRLPPAPTSARAEVARRGLRCGVRRLP